MNKSHVMAGKRSHPLPNSSPSRFGCFWRCCCSILILPPDRKAGTACNREICLVVAEGHMEEGVELSCPNYFWNKPLLKEQEEKVSSRSEIMLASLSSYSSPSYSSASHAGRGCKNTDSRSPSSFFSSLQFPAVLPSFVPISLRVAVSHDVTLEQFMLK